MRFQPSPYSHRQSLIGLPTAAQLNPSLDSRLSDIAGAQVTTAAGMSSFLANVGRAVEAERGHLDGETRANLASMRAEASKVTNPKKLAKYFGDIKAGATSVGAPKSAAAVKSAAKWFYHNVEKGGSTSTPAPAAAIAAITGGGQSALDTGSAFGDTPFYKQPWFIPVAVSGTILLLGTAVILLKD